MAKPLKSILRRIGLASTPTPEVPPPLEMPDEEAIERDKVRDFQRRKKGKGRVASIMSGGSSGLG